MTPAQDPPRYPQRLIGLEAARAAHGETADTMARMLTAGDPLADAVITELDALGKDARHLLNRGLAEGLDSLDSPPPAVAALLRRLESAPEWVDHEALAAGDSVSLSVPPHWNLLAFVAGSLTHTYRSPSIAKLLVQTGQFDRMAPRRLAETGVWRANAILPGGLLHGAPGYVQTAQVRLLHARVRSTAIEHGWDTARWGVPINQVDTARTWLAFTTVPFLLLERVGFALDDREQRRLYRYWWYIAHLLGLDEDLFLGIEDHAGASPLLDLLDSTIAPPDDNSRALVSALYDAAVQVMAAGPGSFVTEAGARAMLLALARDFHGDTLADALGIPPSPAADLLPVMAIGNTQLRHYQSAAPGPAAQERELIGAYYRDLVADLPGRTAYQT
ncbi:oxygenase MpaB family protein [Streptomyces sp. NPDC093252]|uniref:oxygenase MpaB family protein n=1 Tax=Streptomyces sp. NPDC093252 TaxID=3154980 RepID=UPI003416D8D0